MLPGTIGHVALTKWKLYEMHMRDARYRYFQTELN